LNGCCCGRRSDCWLALRLPNHRGEWARRVPTQILEAGWATVVLFGAIALWSHRPFDGALFLYALGGYPIGRLLLERTREVQDRVLGVRLHGALSLLFVLISFSALAIGCYWK
jgi:phosphatidylglycerol---prolipoprotein diacylglyceryl transferase